MKIYPKIIRVGGAAYLSLVTEGLSDADVINIVDELPARNIYLVMDMKRAQEFAVEVEAIVNSELAEDEIRKALGSGKPEEM